MTFICYPKCSTCKKARDFLTAAGFEFTERDIKTQNPTEAELRDWHARSGVPLRRFFNTSGQLYRAAGHGRDAREAPDFADGRRQGVSGLPRS